MMFYGHDLWSGWWMFLWMFLFWGGFAALVIWGLRTLSLTTHPGQSSTATRSPLDIAKERLAKGEISREEFAGIVEDLENTKPPHNP